MQDGGTLVWRIYYKSQPKTWTSVWSSPSRDYHSQLHNTIPTLHAWALLKSFCWGWAQLPRSSCWEGVDEPQSLQQEYGAVLQPGLAGEIPVQGKRSRETGAWEPNSPASPATLTVPATRQRPVLVWLLVKVRRSFIKFSNCTNWRWFCSWNSKYFQDCYFFWKTKVSYTVTVRLCLYGNELSVHIRQLWEF